MKKLMILAATLAALASCGKMETPTTPEPEGIPVNISFGGIGHYTRAFFDNTSEAEPWEKAIHNITVYVYDSEGTGVMVRRFSQADIDRLEGRVYLPASVAGTTCNVYVIANDGRRTTTGYDEERFRKTITWHSYHNGPFDEVTGGCKREGGFIMTGVSPVTISGDGSLNHVKVVLKRVVAKVAVEIDVAPDFSERHQGGTMRIWSGGLNNLTDRGYLFAEETYGHYQYAIKYLTQQTQDPSGTKYQFLVYVVQQGPWQTIDEYPRLFLYGWYDHDGNSDTKDDHVSVKYEIPLTGSGNGEFRRNGYYRIKGTINDFEHLEMDAVYEVSEWESPETDDVGQITITD